MGQDTSPSQLGKSEGVTRVSQSNSLPTSELSLESFLRTFNICTFLNDSVAPLSLSSLSCSHCQGGAGLSGLEECWLFVKTPCHSTVYLPWCCALTPRKHNGSP